MRKPSSPTTALYVRLPAADADKLDRAAMARGLRKKDLVTQLVATLPEPARGRGRRVAGDLPGPGTTAEAARNTANLGSYAFHPFDMPEVLTPSQAAQLLQVTETVVVEMAEAGAIPGRKLGDAWRFSRSALVGWLSSAATGG